MKMPTDSTMEILDSVAIMNAVKQNRELEHDQWSQKAGQVIMIARTKMTAIPAQTKQCPICDKVGSVDALEMLPGGGTLYLSSHEDGTQCQWSKYPDMEAARSAKTDQPSPEIKCPECHELGVIVAERDESDRMEPDSWN